MPDLDKLLSAANDRLRVARLGVAIEFRGKNLNIYLRATLPPQPGNDRLTPYQQRVALKMRASPESLKLAESQAKLIGAELNLGQFDWAKWGGPEDEGLTIGHWLEKFEAAFWGRRGRTNASETHWNQDYRFEFARLDKAVSLTTDLLIETLIAKTEPNSRTRQRCTKAYAALAKFAGLEAEGIRRMKGSYSNFMSAAQRDLPSDEAIVQWRGWLVEHQPQWAWIYGMIAAYGLRPHEVFHVNLEKFPDIRVKDETKTGGRYAVALQPQWAIDWGLDKPRMPGITIDGTESNIKLGGKISRFFLNHPIPFRAYDLRHCWARRAVERSIPPDVAAHLMGHSLKIHLITYRRWIGDQVYLDVAKRILRD
ncbi:MAG: integrase [Drouetiella hepatica Uher 2000/2452]|jgi:integrase|uniref:Integrase n=1 Tax=Drouetiella hepatica Uher 2000/2452 TaxID=904376 RepID=A0A951QFQ5_9CYAN|nr:integrase [Drouetiella hepatica Uher 2000/2452]